MKKLTLVIVTALVILAAVSVTFSQQATLAATAETRDGQLAMSGVDMTRDGTLATQAVYHVSDNAPVLHRLNDCKPYARAMTTFTGGYSHNVILRHGNCQQATVKPAREDKPAVTTTETTVQPESPVVPVIEHEQPTTPEQPVVTDDKPIKDHCDNGAGNGDDCTPGKSSGSNQGNGQQTGDQTNQGEQGNKGGNKPNK